ncbi:MAG: hypothetical protein JNK72_04335 [Myxococcales bacterium]|nr:hypothetical protein [Myxococcales bacterium]
MSTLDLLRHSRWLALGLALTVSAPVFMGCAPDDMTAGDDDEGALAPQEDTTSEEIANVLQSAVRRQSIGNCWIYATLGWVESMNKLRTGVETNYSESYVTFWDWFGKITNNSGVSTETTGGTTRRSIQTGGSWQLAVTLIRQRGMMKEGDFIADEATAEMSARQAAAERVINEALSDGGELATPEARRDGTRVFNVLVRAWNLNSSIATTMRNVFGNGGERRFDGYSNRATSTRTRAVPPNRIQIRTQQLVNNSVTAVNATLADVLPGGQYAWRAADYPGLWNTAGRPAAMRRMLRALNADAPVVVSWLVDFNALDNAGSFRLSQLQSAGRPGRQGGHMTVLHDYQVRFSDGTVLAAGTPASPADRERALTGTVEFLRVKNSWGVSRSDRASMQGYYDLHLDYLHGPIAWSSESNPMSTRNEAPLNEMILPPGF